MTQTITRQAFYKLAYRLDPQSLCRILNLSNQIRGRGIKVSYSSPYFLIKDLNSLFIYEKRRLPWYFAGIQARLDDLARQYALQYVPIIPGDIVIDCGANIGEIALWMDTHHIDAHYIGYEPSLKPYQCARKNIRRGQIYQKALWNSVGHMSLFIGDATADSSLFQQPLSTETTTVETTTLDIEFQLLGIERCKLLKVEAEGAEPEVLEGGKSIISKCTYIAVDVGFERGPEQKSTLPECVNFLLQNDFAVRAWMHGRQVLLFENLAADAATKHDGFLLS